MFKRDGNISEFGNPYIDSLRILTDRIRECNAKFIRDKSGFRLARVMQFILKMVKYASLEGRGWQPLPKFLSKKKAILNIQNNDERCFGYALLYFLERERLPEKHCYQASLYKNKTNVPMSPSPKSALPNFAERCSSIRGSAPNKHQCVFLLLLRWPRSPSFGNEP